MHLITQPFCMFRSDKATLINLVVLQNYDEDLVPLGQVYVYFHPCEGHQQQLLAHAYDVLISPNLNICDEIGDGCLQHYFEEWMGDHGDHVPAKWWKRCRGWLAQAWRLEPLLYFPCCDNMKLWMNVEEDAQRSEVLNLMRAVWKHTNMCYL